MIESIQLSADVSLILESTLFQQCPSTCLKKSVNEVFPFKKKKS